MTATVQTNHFNLHTNGVGYVNRIRWVEPSRSAGRRAEPFLACSIAALRGNADSPDYTYFDLRVSGRDAIEMVERLKVDVEDRRKVFVSFRIGDIYPHVYERDVRDRDGHKTGEKEMASLIKGRLLLINSITIDGENVFRRDPDVETSADQLSPLPQDQDSADLDERASDVESSVERRIEPDRQVSRQPPARPEGQRAAYKGGYAAGRSVREGASRVARAVA